MPAQPAVWGAASVEMAALMGAKQRGGERTQRPQAVDMGRVSRESAPQPPVSVPGARREPLARTASAQDFRYQDVRAAQPGPRPALNLLLARKRSNPARAGLKTASRRGCGGRGSSAGKAVFPVGGGRSARKGQMQTETHDVIEGRYEVRGVAETRNGVELCEAYDRQLDRPVLIQRLTPAASADTERAKRFLRSQQLAASVHNCPILSVYDAGVDAGRPFSVMENARMARLLTWPAPVILPTCLPR